jgi:hypothetical protein
MEKHIISKLKNEFIFLKKIIIIRFVNVEIDPSLQYQQNLYVLKSNVLTFISKLWAKQEAKNAQSVEVDPKFFQP